ncbi:glycosyltransferase [Baekduia sp.]|jgi:glycosyltransferase involved in cell wall biosynthesis|uniref:glycosyltransferase n=1 Tax=Baekduia sp. TaxID=2600305 RepID=UPI002DF8CEE5|nr:glycosyltransferase [Baekduia sp.]
MPRVLVVRGHQATPWDLRQWEALPDRFDVAYLRSAANGWDVGSVALEAVPVRTRRDRLPKGRLGDVATLLAGDAYGAGADEAYAAADVVHAEELAYWFAADAARAKEHHGFKLVQTVWETLPMLRTYRRGASAKLRHEVLAATDLFMPATERARIGLLLEGVPEEKIAVCAPGIDVDRFAAASVPATPPAEHTIVAPGRLVWEKGQHDAIRALALLHRGIVTLPDGTPARPHLKIVGVGPEDGRLRAHAQELGLGEAVTIGAVPYDDMPGVFAGASALLLGSQSSALGGRHPFDVPRAFWEEQFGFVFVEAMAAGLDIVATTNGAIPEVLQGQGTLVPAGDYIGMARALAAGALSRPPGTRVAYPAELLQHYSVGAFADRLAGAYDRVLTGSH